MMEVKILDEAHFDKVKQFDIMSNGDALFFLESNSVYGIFLDELLIGYCSYGGADCEDYLMNHKDWNENSLILSNVFVLEQYRNKGYASKLINESINLNPETKNNSIYITILSTKLQDFYLKLGFQTVDDYTMVKIM